ncbi:S1 family peptidase [Lysobacter enzymogenes]|uniref:S1 family peptidase n=1 Tax=Lysobacter enzymogenes TaxID=69 RepID=UPI001A971FB3|nr:serine protease [Lysobacter enzymogenes]QQP97357.1 serine protease [Lysobacter enzymogenes]
MKASHCIGLATVLALAGLSASAQAAQKDAGDIVRPQIIGGIDVGNGKYPFMVTVQLKLLGGDNAYDNHWCGGSLISPWLVLTAAHCVGFDAAQYTVIAGRTALKNEAQGIKAEVAAAYVHPKYLAGDGGYDVAILELKAPITKIKPVALVTAGTDALERPGTQLTNIGWGNTIQQNPFPPGGNGVNQPNRLQEVQLPVVSYAECEYAYRGTGMLASQALDLCAGRTGKDACQGDSGGPLFVALPGSKNFLQVGVVSRGAGCGATGYPGIFTRVANEEISAFIANPAAKGVKLGKAK